MSFAGGLGLPLLAGAIAFAQPPDAEPTPLPEAVMQLGVHLPQPISDREFDLTCSLLVLSMEQRAHADIAFAGYKAAWNTVLERELPGVQQASEAASATMSPQISAASLPSFDNLTAVEDRVSELLLRSDRELFDEITRTLSDEQTARLPIVVARRARTSCRFLDAFVSIGAANTDLIDLLLRQKVQPGDHDGLAVLIDEYISAIGKLANDLDDRFAQRRFDGMQADAIIVATGETGRKDDLDRAHAEREKILAPEARLQRRLGEVNARYGPQFVALLPAPINEQFMQQYARRAFPSVYPDVNSTNRLIASISASRDLTPEHQQAIGVLLDTSRARYDSICRAMEEAYLDWSEQMARTFSAEGYPAYRDRMRTFRSDRLKANRALISQIQSLLPPAVRDAHTKAIEGWESAASASEKKWETDEYPPQ